MKFALSQRVSSIRTRIKTSCSLPSTSSRLVREYLPLEQGLRHRTFYGQQENRLVREYLPLEQGLRLLAASESVIFCVREYLPLEQGLRLHNGCSQMIVLCQRVSSIRTRIKTSISSAHVYIICSVSESIFH